MPQVSWTWRLPRTRVKRMISSALSQPSPTATLITLYDELDRSTVFNFPLRSIEFTITNPRTGEIIRGATEIRSRRKMSMVGLFDVAVLAGSQFVKCSTASVP